MLSNQVRGFIISILQDGFFGFHNEIDAFAMSISGELPGGTSVASKLHYFIMGLPEAAGEELIRRTVEVINKRYLNIRDEEKKKLLQDQALHLRDLVQNTMQMYLEDDGRLTSISPAHTQIPSTNNYIEKKLNEFLFLIVLKDFKESSEVYHQARRSPINELRTAYEGLVREILKHFQIASKNMRDDLQALESKGVLLETQYNKPDQHLEVSHSYNLYGLLSNYGAHPNPLPNDVTFTLFLETTSWIYLILNRFDQVK